MKYIFSFILLLTVTIIISNNYICFPFNQDNIYLKNIKLPPGFKRHIFADKVTGARSLARGTRGTIFVSTRSPGKVYALQDINNDY